MNSISPAITLIFSKQMASAYLGPFNSSRCWMIRQKNSTDGYFSIGFIFLPLLTEKTNSVCIRLAYIHHDQIEYKAKRVCMVLLIDPRTFSRDLEWLFQMGWGQISLFYLLSVNNFFIALWAMPVGTN